MDVGVILIASIFAGGPGLSAKKCVKIVNSNYCNT